MKKENLSISETFALASQHHEKKDYQVAEKLYRKIIETEPNHLESIFRLGSLQIQTGNFDKAQQLLNKAVQIDSNHAKAHNNLGIAFQKMKKYQEAISCYEKAVEIIPGFADAYCNLALLYTEINKDEKALHCCDQVINLVPDMLKAINLKSEILKRNIPLWHAPMINDDSRNNFYLSALKSVVKKNSSVFEIGTGSALLSIMAANLGAQEINTCETSSIMANIATKIITDNNLAKKINVIQKKSNDIKVGKDIDKPADILVSEIFSSNLLSEGVLPSIEDAKSRLISKNAKIIPEYASIMISLFGGDDIGKNIYTEKFKNIKLKKFNSIIAKKHILHRQDLKIDLMSKAFEAFRFDFVNNNSFLPENKKIEIEAIKKGRSYGIIQWIKLEMSSGLNHENHPESVTKASGWQKVLYLFDEPIELTIGQKLFIRAKHERNIVWFFLDKNQ